MFSPMFDWQDAHYFAALARSGSLSAAARDLGVDHATVGRRVAAFEKAIGIKLVDRLPRSCPLTHDGRNIAKLVSGMEETAHAIHRQSRSPATRLTGVVRVSAPPALAAYAIAPRTGELRHAFPDLKLILLASAAFAALDRGEADIAIRMSRPREKAAVTRRIGKMRFAAYATPAVASLHADDWQFIAFDAALDDVPQQRWLHRSLNGRQIAFEASDLFGQQAAARSGIGVAVLPTIMGDGDPALTRVALAPEPPPRDLWLVTYPDVRRSPAVRTVMSFLTACMEREPGLKL